LTLRDEYIDGVAWQLRDLPWHTRRDLIQDLHDHLDELPAGEDLLQRLGAPAAYAADLRAAAHLVWHAARLRFSELVALDTWRSQRCS
jgi:uncharacterized membrane protein